MNIQIREALESDLNRINDIYNYYVTNSTCTAQEVPDTLDDRKKWFDRLRAAGLPVIVAQIDGKVVGWGSLCMFNERSAYRYCVENSVYVDYQYFGRQIGSVLLTNLLEIAKKKNFTNVIAKINSEQSTSIKFHKKFGFENVRLFEKCNLQI